MATKLSQFLTDRRQFFHDASIKAKGDEEAQYWLGQRDAFNTVLKFLEHQDVPAPAAE